MYARAVRRRLLDRLARRLGYVPADLLRPRWQMVKAPMELPDLEEGRYDFSAWVMVPPLSDADHWWVDGLALEARRPPWVMRAADQAMVAAGEL